MGKPKHDKAAKIVGVLVAADWVHFRLAIGQAG